MFRQSEDGSRENKLPMLKATIELSNQNSSTNSNHYLVNFKSNSIIPS